MAAAPIKLLKLEFVIPEEKFDHQLSKAEHTLKQCQEQLASNTNVKDALQKHRVSRPRPLCMGKGFSTLG